MSTILGLAIIFQKAKATVPESQSHIEGKRETGLSLVVHSAVEATGRKEMKAAFVQVLMDGPNFKGDKSDV